ncbi:hypothetical protein KKJ04_18830 [Xenorhabdus bovienii]|uniref:hypothetical protein n=1 Tax=Xenorhabdus bovienii TaxID=40576 RepID=UPI0023B22798|nr:hypothetical protein [Xenorhabdus bovienii]MDE9447587.1 hypothetical protein [Xenorhabdus bovienii]
MEDKVKIQKSNDYKSYFAENCGIIDSSIDGAELCDIVILKRESTPILLSQTKEGDEVEAQISLETELQHICSIRMTHSLLKDLYDAIGRTLSNKEQ